MAFRDEHGVLLERVARLEDELRQARGAGQPRMLDELRQLTASQMFATEYAVTITPAETRVEQHMFTLRLHPGLPDPHCRLADRDCAVIR